MDDNKRLNLNVIFWSGVFGAIFAFLSSIADVLSGFTKMNIEGLYFSTHVLEFKYLEPLVREKTYEILIIGDYLAVFLIPASFIGIYHIHRILKLDRHDNLLTKIFLPGGVYTYTLGAILHAKSTTVIGAIVFANNNSENLEGTPYWSFLQNIFTPFGWTVAGFMLGLLTLFSLYIVIGKTPYPKKMVFVSPLVLQLYAGIIMLFPYSVLKNYLAVASWNLSMAIFFAISTYWFYIKHRDIDSIIID